MACAPNLQGVFMETARSDSQPGVTMATEQADLRGVKREKMATDSTGCSGEVCRGPGTRWAGGAERVSRWLRVCICGRPSRREIFSPHPLSKETKLLGVCSLARSDCHAFLSYAAR